MAETFKKGQLVPKRLGFIHVPHKKARAGITFGSDVIVVGRVITQIGQPTNPVIYVRNKRGRRMNNGTYQKMSSMHMIDVTVIVSNYPHSPT